VAIRRDVNECELVDEAHTGLKHLKVV